MYDCHAWCYILYNTVEPQLSDAFSLADFVCLSIFMPDNRGARQSYRGYYHSSFCYHYVGFMGEKDHGLRVQLGEEES